MTDPATRDRLTTLQARLEQPTPRPLEGQQAIPIPADCDVSATLDTHHDRTDTAEET